ncbi:MAG: DUF7010 family protein [Vicinamibacterales bacterium]
MILLGAHYLPFVTLYGMRMFAALAGLLVAGGVVIAMYRSESFSLGAWFTGATLLVFAGLGRATAEHQWRVRAAQRATAAHQGCTDRRSSDSSRRAPC